MRKTTHTAGPWQALPEECDKPYIRVRGTAIGSRYKIANVVTPTYGGVHPREAEERRRNAQLLGVFLMRRSCSRSPLTVQGSSSNGVPAFKPSPSPHAMIWRAVILAAFKSSSQHQVITSRQASL